eukprot:2948380-Lingulodinium_polyedra.AAC.1
MPAAMSWVGAPWACRVEAADAAPGGHGRAWAEFPVEVVAALSRASDTKGGYTHLGMEEGELLEAARCPMQRVRWPVASHSWTRVGRPGGYRFIALEEMDATLWSVESRLRRPREL